MKNGDYILVVAPKKYPGKKYRGKYCLEHHLVWWENTGELLLAGELIHHKNENKHDNTFNNLSKMTIQKHNKIHKKEKQMVELKCPYCKKLFIRERRQTHLVKKKNRLTFCSRQCNRKYYSDS